MCAIASVYVLHFAWDSPFFLGTPLPGILGGAALGIATSVTVYRLAARRERS